MAKKRVQCTHEGCKETMVEERREYVGISASSNRKVYRFYMKCPKGHTDNWKDDE